MKMIHKFAAVQSALGERQIRVIASDATPDRVGDIMVPTGCNCENYRKNPIVLAGHDTAAPVGRAYITVLADRVEALITFAAKGASAIADEVCALAKDGVLNAVSIGFRPIDEQPIKGGGWLFKAWELLELSLVSIPANPNALIIEKSARGSNMFAQVRRHDSYEQNPAAVLGGVLRLFASLNPGSQADQIAEAEKVYGVRHPVVKCFTKALEPTLGAAGGFVIPPEFAGDLVQLLLPLAVMRRAGATAIPMRFGNMTFATVTAGATVSWMPNVSRRIPASQPAFGALIATFHKLAALVPISGDLLRYALPEWDARIGTHLAQEIAAGEDLQFIRGSGEVNTPPGLRHFANGAGNVVTSAATATALTILAELTAAVAFLFTANVPLRKPAWIFHGATELYLRQLQTTTGQFPFAHEMSQGRLLGYPFFATSNIPVNLTVGDNVNSSEVYFFDAAEAMIFEGPELEITLSREGVYIGSSGVYPGFQTDTCLLRCVAGRDFMLEHMPACSYINGTLWHL